MKFKHELAKIKLFGHSSIVAKVLTSCTQCFIYRKWKSSGILDLHTFLVFLCLGFISFTFLTILFFLPFVFSFRVYPLYIFYIFFYFFDNMETFTAKKGWTYYRAQPVNHEIWHLLVWEYNIEYPLSIKLMTSCHHISHVILKFNPSRSH